jgi:hypothetical protein
MLETFYEYYVENLDEVVDFLKMFAINADTYDYKQYLDKKVEEPKTSNILTGI